MIDDYNNYHFDTKDYIVVIGLSCMISLGVAYLFYKSLVAALFLLPSFFIISNKYKRRKVKLRKEQLTVQFKDAIQSISSALEAGYSIENAVKFALNDLKLMYEAKSYINIELQRILAMIANSTPIEDAIEDFAQRSKLEDIICFSEVFQSAKRSGGDLVYIIKHTSRIISEKIEVSHAIETLITAKKLEVTIMKSMPFAILGYLMICSDGFLDPLYGNMFGKILMTIVLVVTVGLSFIADQIMNIEV